VVVAVLLTSDGDAPRDGDRPKSTLHVAPTIGVGSFGLSFGGAL
jgi:hypothetical protein